jgi:hypothetical protein
MKNAGIVHGPFSAHILVWLAWSGSQHGSRPAHAFGRVAQGDPAWSSRGDVAFADGPNGEAQGGNWSKHQRPMATHRASPMGRRPIEWVVRRGGGGDGASRRCLWWRRHCIGPQWWRWALKEPVRGERDETHRKSDGGRPEAQPTMWGVQRWRLHEHWHGGGIPGGRRLRATCGRWGHVVGCTDSGFKWEKKGGATLSTDSL